VTFEQLAHFFDTWPVHAPLQEIRDPRRAEHNVRLYLKREDWIHPWVAGNKWRKLKYNLLRARELDHHTLLTFGGAYSNHILATAAAGDLFGFRTIGIIRGEAHAPLNPVLARAQSHGMALHYMARSTYRRKTDPAVLDALRRRYGRVYLIPEGGSNALAVRGCREIVAEIDVVFDTICCACGTGGTLAGLVAGMDARQRALGMAVLKGKKFLDAAVRDLLPPVQRTRRNWAVCYDYHGGGYAKQMPGLLEFIEHFHAQHEIRLDPVYTGKMLMGLFDLVQRGAFAPGSTIVALHTGNYRER